MAGSIFVSYRREDSQHAAGRLVDRLTQSFGKDRIFMDVDAIEPGLDFVEVIGEKVASCDVLLALIGPRWLEASEQGGRPRLDNPSDFVRLEIEAALRRSIRVIPVLLDGASPLEEDSLPHSLKALARRQAVRITHERFAADAAGLVQSLAKAAKPARPAASWAGAPRTSRPDAPPASGGLISRGMAWGYVLLAVPMWFVIALVLFNVVPPNIFVTSEADAAFSATLLGALLVATIGGLLRRSRGTAGTPSELALYWIGAILPVLVIMLTGLVFNLQDGHPRSDKQGWGAAALAAVPILVALTIAMIFDLRRRKSAIKVN
ncbi:MAG TPA: toll/interleukin-1 receptor domain-containing protein [Hyphomicrobiaceae bacterium]|jgi:hypothetical protein|nr:toll/interleukin-1 receptor domain-containing protein [Hyphomicrobiaceae bacterium]